MMKIITTMKTITTMKKMIIPMKNNIRPPLSNPFSLFFIMTTDVAIKMLRPVIIKIAGVMIFSVILLDVNIIPNI